MTGPYTLSSNGDLVFKQQSRGTTTQLITIDSAENFGIFFDTEDGVLHKHGAAEGVAAYAKKIRATYADAGFQDIADGLVYVEIPVSSLTRTNMLDEINKAVEITGYMKGFEAKLKAATQEVEMS